MEGGNKVRRGREWSKHARGAGRCWEGGFEGRINEGYRGCLVISTHVTKDVQSDLLKLLYKKWRREEQNLHKWKIQIAN